MKGLAGPLEPGIRCEEGFQHDRNQGFGFLFGAIGLGIDRRIVGKRGREIGFNREGQFDRRAIRQLGNAKAQQRPP